MCHKILNYITTCTTKTKAFAFTFNKDIVLGRCRELCANYIIVVKAIGGDISFPNHMKLYGFQLYKAIQNRYILC